MRGKEKEREEGRERKEEEKREREREKSRPALYLSDRWFPRSFTLKAFGRFFFFFFLSLLDGAQ